MASPIGRGTAGGKAILLGEHAVVYGVPAVAIPVADLGIEVDIGPGGGWDLEPDAEVHQADLARARDALLAAAGWSDQTPRVRIRSTLPTACGLGSSAAISVALARAVRDALGQPGDDQDVARLAGAAERVFHGNPSGVDVATVMAPGPIRFDGGEVTALPPGGRLDLWVVDSGVRSRTSAVVGSVAALRSTEPAVFEAGLEEVRSAVERGVEALAAGSVADLGGAMALAMTGLRRLGVSHPAIEAVVEDAARRGAAGAKLSGAGRGGVVLVLAPDAGWEPGGRIGGGEVLARIRLGG